MRILYVVSGFKPAWGLGGAVRVSYELCRSLCSPDTDIEVYTTDKLAPGRRIATSYDESEGFKVHYFRNISNTLALRHLPLAPALLAGLDRAVQHADIVHIHEYRTLHGSWAAHVARTRNIPYIIQAHGSVLPAFQKKRFKCLFDTLWGYTILKNAAKIIALTDNEAAQYRQMGVGYDRIAVIANGINPADYTPLPPNGTFRARYGIRPDEPIVLFLGRLNRIKGIDRLVRAYADLRKEHEDVRLVIAGPDNGYLSQLRNQLKALELENPAIITGPLYGDEKLAAYREADVYVLPSVYETFPMTALEACACGTPVILTEGCGSADLFRRAGATIVPDEPSALRSAIESTLDDREGSRARGQQGREYVVSEFNWARLAGAYMKVYESCGGEAPAGA